MIKKAKDILAEVGEEDDSPRRRRRVRAFEWAPDLLTVSEAADILKVHRTSVARIVKPHLTDPVHRWHRAEIERIAALRANRRDTVLGSYEELGLPKLGPEHPSQ